MDDEGLFRNAFLRFPRRFRFRFFVRFTGVSKIRLDSHRNERLFGYTHRYQMNSNLG